MADAQRPSRWYRVPVILFVGIVLALAAIRMLVMATQDEATAQPVPTPVSSRRGAPSTPAVLNGVGGSTAVVSSALSRGIIEPITFRFDIDANTPVQDLLPVPPKTEVKVGPLFPTELAQVPEIAFQAPFPADITGHKAMEMTARQIAKINHLNQKKSDAFMEALLARRPELAGLPFAMGDACRTTGERTRRFKRALATVRMALASSLAASDVFQALAADMLATQAGAADSPRTEPANAFWNTYVRQCAEEDKKIGRESREQVALARIAALMQVLGPESQGLRKGLAEYLSTVAHPEATRALTKLAIFSSEGEVHLAAVEALRVRRERDYTDILVRALRYPLPAVARRAGETIVALERKDLIPELLTILEEPDPRAPVTKEVEGKRVPIVRELVRLNHHRNCLMCHAPGNTPTVSTDAVTAQVPVPGEALPTPATGYQNSIQDLLVRVDVTYLRQDFSVRLPVADANPWPEMQRFDFLVRTRELTEGEARNYRDHVAKREPGVLSDYDRSALMALRGLTGRDTEPTAQAWRKLLDVPTQRHQDHSY